MKRSIKNLKKKEKLKIGAMTKIMGGQADDGGFCMIDNVGAKETETDGGIAIQIVIDAC